MSLGDVREQEYRKALEANALRRLVFTPDGSTELLPQLVRIERELRTLTREREELELAEAPGKELRGAETTGLMATVALGLAEVPTAVYQFLDPAAHPLVSCEIRNIGKGTRRVRIVSYVEGYSARAVDTVEVEAGDSETVSQQPVLFAHRMRDLTERTTAALNVSIEDLDDTDGEPE